MKKTFAIATPLLALIALAIYSQYGSNNALSPSTQSETNESVLPHDESLPSMSSSSATESLQDPRFADLVDLYNPPEFDVSQFDQFAELGETWAITYSNVIDAALAGEPAAQFGLFVASHRCYSAPKTEDELAVQKEIASAPYYDGSGTLVTESPKFAKAIEDLESVWKFCQDSDPEQLPKYNEWLTSAAESGYIPALLAWGRDSPGDENRNLDDPDDREYLEAKFRNRLRYLERAKEAGSINAVNQLATIHLMGKLNPLSGMERDLKKSFANMYAYAWYRAKSNNDDQTLKYMHQMGMQLSPHEFAEGVHEGQEILTSKECCIAVSKN